VREIARNSPLIRCNFDPGEPYDVAAMMEAQKNWTDDDWGDRWDSHSLRDFAAEPPLPPWHELRWQRVLVRVGIIVLCATEESTCLVGTVGKFLRVEVSTVASWQFANCLRNHHIDLTINFTRAGERNYDR
jgi:hypothetical protein